MRPLERSLDEFHQEFGLVRQELSRLMAQVRKLQRRTDQLFALRVEELDASARLEKLERILDFEAVTAHLRTAVAQATLIQDPIRHLWVPDLLPTDVYQALVDAIPARVFFEGRVEHGLELRVPPRVAPTHTVVTWAFLTDLVLRSLGPLLVTRFQEPLDVFTRTRFPALPPFREWGVEVTLSEGRIVSRGLGYVGAAAQDRQWDFLTTVLCLARPHDNEECGSRLGSKVIPFRANLALTFLGSTQAHEYVSIPDSAADTERYTYEFGIGPNKEGRRRLAAMIDGKD